MDDRDTVRRSELMAALFGGVLPLLLWVILAGAARADLYSHWPLDDGSGDEARNLGAQGENAIIYDFDIGGLADDGSVWVEDPDHGMVLGLAGAYAEAGEIPVMTLQQDFTWALWVKQHETQATPSNLMIAGNRYGFDGADTVPREFIKFTPNRFEFHMNAGVQLTNNPDGTESYQDDLQYVDCDFCPERHIPSDPSEWMHHTVVKSGPTLTYYRNGAFGNSKDVLTSQLSPNPLPFNLGGQNAAELWTGYLSDIRLYDHALTAEEVAELAGVVTVPGDYNNNGELDAGDLDLQAIAIAGGQHPKEYDLNGDDLVNFADRQVWVNDLKNTWIGDANLDLEFNSSDMVQVFVVGKYELDQDAKWEEGDWDGNQRFNSGDMVAAFVAGGYEKGLRTGAAAVPEPASVLLLLTGLIGVGIFRCCHQS